jgi:hypothetical protein
MGELEDGDWYPRELRRVCLDTRVLLDQLRAV